MNPSHHHPDDRDRLALPVEVESVIAEAQEQGWLALDTEFLRQETYYAELCLVQIATQNSSLLLEGLDARPVGQSDLRGRRSAGVVTAQSKALERLLTRLAPDDDQDVNPGGSGIARPTIVVHSGVQDFEILGQIRPQLLQFITDPPPDNHPTDDTAEGRRAITNDTTPHIIEPPFDTQIAASFLGLSHQVSYQALVEARLGVSLDKTQSCTDWSQRPLSPAQRQYAIDDVVYLAELFPSLCEDLQKNGLEAMVKEETARIYQQALTLDQPKNLWKRVRGAQRLPRPALAILQEMAIWREKVAMKRDRPRRWILADDVAINIARAAMKKDFALDHRGGRAGRWTPEERDELLAGIERGRQRPIEMAPEHSTPLTQEQYLALKAIDSAARATHQKIIERFTQRGIADQWAGSPKALAFWAIQPDQTPWAAGWRAELVSDLTLPLRQSALQHLSSPPQALDERSTPR
ncbi:MAG: ribonuclease D [Thioalkalivibrionaceae bacterium]